MRCMRWHIRFWQKIVVIRDQMLSKATNVMVAVKAANDKHKYVTFINNVQRQTSMKMSCII